MTGMPEERASALLAPVSFGKNFPALAEMCIRRLANRHGCHYEEDGAGRKAKRCPDPGAHARDVADMRTALEVVGLLPAERAPRDMWGNRRQGGTA